MAYNILILSSNPDSFPYEFYRYYLSTDLNVYSISNFGTDYIIVSSPEFPKSDAVAMEFNSFTQLLVDLKITEVFIKYREMSEDVENLLVGYCHENSIEVNYMGYYHSFSKDILIIDQHDISVFDFTERLPDFPKAAFEIKTLDIEQVVNLYNANKGIDSIFTIPCMVVGVRGSDFVYRETTSLSVLINLYHEFKNTGLHVEVFQVLHKLTSSEIAALYMEFSPKRL